jgi:hypothetical protein
MKTTLLQILLGGVFLAAPLCPAQTSGEKSAAAGRSRSDSVLVTLTASVESINATNRELTLKGPLGNEVTVTADKRVKRLSEIKVGDMIRADYYLSVAADLRAPTPEEEKTPFVMLDAVGKAPAGEAPGAAGVRRFKVVATVEGLDRPTQTVTVKGPLGNYFTARVADVSNLTRLKIDDKIVLTCTEAVAISLEAATPAVAK